jgi:type IV pilus assembly protein PilO
MANLRETRRRLRWVAGILLVLNLVAAAILLTPLAGSGAAREEEFQQVRGQVQSRLKTVVPPEQVQKRVDEARQQIDNFYGERLPATMSQITESLGEVASQSGVHLLNAKYDTTDSDLPGLQQVQIEAALSGDYLQEVKFINALERQNLFFVVNGVTLGEREGGQVQLSVTLETYLKSGV